MKENIRKVLEMWEKGIPLNEIEASMNLTTHEFNKTLKAIRDLGYNSERVFYNDGRIIMKPSKRLNLNPTNNIRINVKSNRFRTIFISDLHIGSRGAKPEYLKQVVYEYALPRGIHIIFNGGDVIENIYPESPEKPIIPTVEGQIKKAISIHPHEPNLTYFMLYGNHDYKSILDKGLDIGRYINDIRYDMVSLGYGKSTIYLKDDRIILTHELRNHGDNSHSDDYLIFKGHSHKSKNRENKIIYIPSLSEGKNTSYEFQPLTGFLDVEFIFYSNKISRVNIRQLAFVNKEIRLANEETIILREPKERPRGKTLTKKPKKFSNNSQDSKK